MTEYRTAAGPLRAIVDELIRGGIRGAVICPGSRSTPLALALRAAPELETWVHLDERAGAYFALGAAKASRRPVAILATSGTAVVNFAPAVAEARYGRVPLILLTADRPPELQGIGAPQAIDQVELFGRHAKWYAELPVPDDSDDTEAEARSLVSRALAVATAAPAGPVQLNLPFREPLLPEGPFLWASSDQPIVDRAVPPVATEDLVRILPTVRAAAHPLVVCGPLDAPGFAPAVSSLAAVLGAPILADALSNVRLGRHDRSAVMARYDALLRTESFPEKHRPDLVIRFGATPTSKVLAEMLGRLDAPQWLVDDGHGWNQPTGPKIIRIDADPVALSLGLVRVAAGEASADPAWLAGWRAADAAAAAALDTWRADLGEPFEGAVPWALAEALPEGALVMAGNSMPVRDLDAFLPTAATDVRLLGNRGANGIDGLVSTALGAAATGARPVVAVVGDLSFLHDLNALVAAGRLGLGVTLVLVNNDGGGIFSFLPQATADLPEAGLPAHFEELYGTPHGLDLAPLVLALGARHAFVDGTSLVAALRDSVGQPGVQVLELRTDRVRNVELHRAAQASVASVVETSW